MFTHLILNAVEAMPKGGDIRLIADARADAVTVSVTDTGTGMSDSARKRCFLPFFSTKEGAAGIGLSLAQGIVQQHGGKIGIESQVGAGTTVFVELPLAGQNLRAAVAETPAALAQRPLSMLLVEDDEWTREAIARHLASESHRLEMAANGSTAVEKLRQTVFDVIITDRAMPDISGEEIAREAKRLRPNVFVVLLTGFGSLMREQGEKPACVDIVLGKPVNFAELSRALAELTRTKRPAG
jgi:two-component system, cell cycle sensor histidine kinase and response regulator CckA